MGATGALILAIAKRRLTLASVKTALDATTRLSAFVMMILIGARVFGLTFYGINGNVWIEELLMALPGGEYGFLIVVTIIVFILGCFLDFFEIAFIMVPLLAPVADKLGIDLVWFGIILGINLQTSFLTPPFGFSLFFLRSIAPERNWTDKVTGKDMPGVKTTEIYKGVLPFIVIQFIMIIVIIAFPGLVMHYKDEAPKTDPANIQIEMPGFGTPGQAPGGGTNPFGLPPIGGAGAGAPAPAMGLPPLTFGGDAPASGNPAPAAPTAPAAPSFGLPPLDGLPGQQPAATPAPQARPDLTQPPKF